MRIYFLLFLAVSCASARYNTTSSSSSSSSDRDVDKDTSIRAPVLTSLTAQDQYGYKLKWEPVKSNNGDPIVGYKVKVWEQQKQSQYRNEESNSSSKSTDEAPTYDPKEVLTTKADVHEVSSRGLEPGITYEFRVQAFTKKGDGPLSAPLRLQYRKTDTNEYSRRNSTASQNKRSLPRGN